MAEPPTIEQSTVKGEGKRSRWDAPATPMEVDMAVVQTHAQWWHPVLKPKFGAYQSSFVEGIGGAISAWVADERNRVLGQEITLEEEEMHTDLVRAGKLRELEAWMKFDVFPHLEACDVRKRVVQSMLVMT